MTAPDSPVPLVASQTTSEEVDLETLPGLPSLAQFSTRGLLFVTTATSVVVAILFGLYPMVFRCSHADVATATLWSVGIFISFVLLFYLRRSKVEAKAGKRYLRIAWRKQMAPVPLAALYFGASGIQLGLACLNFAERHGNVIFAILMACAAGCMASVGFLRFAWGRAIPSFEICDNGITTHPLWFDAWSSRLARSLELQGDSLSIAYDPQKPLLLPIDAHQRAIVDAILARHARSTRDVDRSLANSRQTDDAPSAPRA